MSEPNDAQAAKIPTPANPAVENQTPVEAGAEAPAGPSKSELKRRAKEAEKAKKAAERAAREEEEKKKRAALDAVDNASENYGKLPLHMSQDRKGQKFLKFQSISKEDVGKPVVFRARLHNMRPQGAKIVFLTFRQQTHTLQGVLVVSGEKDEHQVSKQMLKFAQGIPSESLVLVEGVIKEAEVKSCSITGFEIGVRKLFTSVEVPSIPFSIDDASRPESDFERVGFNGCGIADDRWKRRMSSSPVSPFPPVLTTVSWT